MAPFYIVDISVSILALPLVLGSLYDPHLYPKTGPFFEGWYARITDFDKTDSIGLLFGSVLPESNNSVVSKFPLVLASILYRRCSNIDGNQCKLTSVNGKFDSKDLHITVNGHNVSSQPDVRSPANFVWKVSKGDQGGYLRQVNGKTTFTFRLGDMSLRGEATSPYPWNSEGTGPEGMLVYLPLPLHWFVFSLRSNLSFYELQNTTSGEVLSGRHGSVHLEKNWGQSFPERWIWAEGVSKKDNASFALSGGKVSFFSQTVSVDAYLIGYKNPSKEIDINFTPANSLVSVNIQGCNGTVQMTVNSLSYKVEISLSAQNSSLSDCLFGPEASGFRESCVESYDAVAEIKVYSRTLLVATNVIDHKVLTNTALEFGGTYVCGDKCASV